MDPNNQPTSPTPGPLPPSSPQPPMPQVPPQVYSANSQPKKKLPLIIGIIVVLLLLIGGGVAYAVKHGKKTGTSSTVNSSTGSSTTAGSSSSATAKTSASGAKCLNLSDFPTEQASDFSNVETVFFKADSTEYEFPEQMVQNLQPLINAYNKYKGRKFKIQVTGSVRLGDNASQALAKARADKVTALLVSKGIPNELLYQGNAQDSSKDPNSPLAADDSNRNVAIQIDTCDPKDPNYVAP